MKSILIAIYNVFLREVQRITSRGLYFFAVLVFPILTILFFASLFSQGVPTKMPIAVVDLDQTATSRKFIRTIDATPLSEVRMSLQNVNDALSELRTGNIYGVVVLPKSLQSDLMAAKQPRISYYYQNALLIPGALIQNNLTLALHTISAGVNMQKRQAMGQPEKEIMANIQPIQISTHQLFNPTSNYSTYISTIVLPIMLQIFILMITVYSIGIEIKDKTSREWLRVADKSVVAALIGKLLPYTIVFFIVIMFQNLVLFKVLQVPILMNTSWLILSSFLFVVAYQAVGVFFIGLLPLLRFALYLTAFYGILAFTLCGFSFPIESMPPIFQLWSNGFPVRHYMLIFHSMGLAGFEPKYSVMSFLALLLFLLLPIIVLPRLKSALIYQNFIENIKGIRPQVNLADSSQDFSLENK